MRLLVSVGRFELKDYDGVSCRLFTSDDYVREYRLQYKNKETTHNYWLWFLQNRKHLKRIAIALNSWKIKREIARLKKLVGSL